MAALFFDIDGTLWDANNVNYIPDSTQKALMMLRENGHYIFICSGRTRVLILPSITALGFDGLLCGCGTHIEYRGETLLYKKLEDDLVKRSVDIFYSYDMPMVLEGRHMLYMDPEIISRDPYGKYLLDIMQGSTLSVRGSEGHREVSKFSVLIKDTDYEGMKEQLKEYYDFIDHSGFAAEIVPKGYSKATSIDFMCRYLGVDIKDTYAFGDSANDVEMLDFVGTGVVMGNGTAEAKEHADYVTDGLHDDGIYNACRHFGLI